jgi:hypothetical protein
MKPRARQVYFSAFMVAPFSQLHSVRKVTICTGRVHADGEWRTGQQRSHRSHDEAASTPLNLCDLRTDSCDNVPNARTLSRHNDAEQ